MFFKNLKIYQLNVESMPTASRLNSHPFKPCEPSQLSSIGWIPPLKSIPECYSRDVNASRIICLRKEDKIIPNDVVSRELEKHLDDVQNRTGSRPIGKAKQALKEDIVASLLPKAFSKYTDTYAYIDYNSGVLIVDSASVNKAEELIEFLIRTEECLAVTPFKVDTSYTPQSLMTKWVSDGVDESDFIMGDECELSDVFESGASIIVKKEDLSSDEIQSHIDSGKSVVKLALNWDNNCSFILENDLTIKRLKFSARAIDNDDVVCQFDADMYVMISIIRNILRRIVSILTDGRV